MSQPKVVLISMPWAQLTLPSIQLGTVASILGREGVEVQSRYFYLEFMEFLLSKGVSVPEYDDFAERSWLNGFGDWLFARPPLVTGMEGKHEEYLGIIKQFVSPEFFASGMRMREYIDEFIEHCAQSVLQAAPDIAAFTTTFSQNMASLLLAHRLKRARPDLVILFGGANCDGPMGVALHRGFDCIDFVIRGEAEYTLPAFIKAFRERGDFSEIPGLVYRSGGMTQFNTLDNAKPVAMADVPVPDYDGYFNFLAGSRLRGIIEPGIRILVESSRGCWWGEKHHCTFCGLNGSTIGFRSKDPQTFTDEVFALSHKYRRVAFQCVDNILDMRYLNTFLPAIAQARERGDDFTLFYETKANLKKAHLQTLRDAGVTMIQPGIESLSTPILKLMRKGVTALQNIRLLKWAKEYGIRVSWNLIFGFPGESVDEYVRMNDLLLSISHFDGPGFSPLLLERFSPYFESPESFGIRITGPKEFYEYVYPLPKELLMDIAYDFSFEVEGREFHPIYREMQQRVVALWPPETGPAGPNRFTLTYERGANFITIRDRRRGLAPQTLTLTDVSADIYLACDAGAKKADLIKLAESDGRASGEAVCALLDALVAKRLMFEEDGTYLSLAVSKRPILETQLDLLKKQAV